MARPLTIGPEPWLLRMFGFDKPLSRRSMTLPFPGAMGVEAPTLGSQNPVAQMYSQLLQFEEERSLLYVLYDEMELDPTIYSYLEQLSEDATQRDTQKGVVVWAEAEDTDVERIANDVLQETGLAEDLAQPIIRGIAKNGEDFEFVVAEPNEGVTRVINYHPATISRIHDEYGRMKGFTPYQTEDTNYFGGTVYKKKDISLMSTPWDFLHFRRLGRSPSRIYGTSTLYGARRIWRQVQMMEDKVALMRLLRQPSRYKHKVDVTGLGPVDAELKIEKYRTDMKRDYRFDTQTGDFASVYNLLSEHEDLFIQVRDDDKGDIEVLSGVQGMDDMRDLEMFLNRMFGALRAPGGYFGFEGGANFERTPSQQDIRFARQAAALQRVYLTEVARVVMIHLMYKGIDPYSAQNQFVLNMVPPSSLEELYRLEVMETRIRTLSSMVQIGEALMVDKKTWMKVVLSEFAVFSRSFTDIVLHAITEIQDTTPDAPPEGVAEKVVKMPAVKKQLDEGIKEMEKNGRQLWKRRSQDVHIPKDMRKLISEDKRDKKERAKMAGEMDAKIEKITEIREDEKKKKNEANAKIQQKVAEARAAIDSISRAS